MPGLDHHFMLRLREALEASWDPETAYRQAVQAGNPSFAQCYPTSRVVQHFYPQTEILKGTVHTRDGDHDHFWNALRVDGDWYHIDLSWQQFPHGSVVRRFEVLDRNNLGDSEATVARCALLLRRVEDYLLRQSSSAYSAE